MLPATTLLRRLYCLLTLAPLGIAGCGSDEIPDTAETRLYAIAEAYCNLQDMPGGKPPATLDELRTMLAEFHEAGMGRDPDLMLRSPRDGQPFVIILGQHVSLQGGDAIWVYEQQGAEGTRYVMTLNRTVKQVPHENFAQASFVKGHKPQL
jgi:hypothetical protein